MWKICQASCAVPGGIDGGNRLALRFGAFAPWDEMNVATKVTLRNVRKGDPIAIIYIPSATLARYGVGVAANGTFMVFDVIPFYEVKSIWIGKSNGGKRLEYVDVKSVLEVCGERDLPWLRQLIPRVGVGCDVPPERRDQREDA